MSEGRKRAVQVPGGGAVGPDEVEKAADPVAEPAAAPVEQVVDKHRAEYWRDKPAAEAQRYWESLPAERKTAAWNVLCSDGWYCAPWVDPRLAAGVRGV